MRTCFTFVLASLLFLSAAPARAQSVTIGAADLVCEYATQCASIMVGCGCCGESAEGQYVVANARTISTLAPLAKCSSEQLKACSKRTDCPRPQAPAVTCENKRCVMKPKAAEAAPAKPLVNSK